MIPTVGCFHLEQRLNRYHDIYMKRKIMIYAKMYITAHFHHQHDIKTTHTHTHTTIYLCLITASREEIKASDECEQQTVEITSQ